MDFDTGPAEEKLRSIADGAVEALPDVLVAIVVFVVFLVFASLLRLAVRGASDRAGRRRNLGLVLGRLMQATTLLIGFLIACIIIFPTFQPGDLIQILGIGSVAIGFAFRDILQNFLSGILILLTEPFRIDDQIVFGEFEGTVEDIQTRATTLRTYDGRRIVIPNAQLFINPVTVNTAFAKRRLEYDVGIAYEANIRDVKALVLSVVQGIEGVLAEPAPDVLVYDLADSAVILRVRWWIQPPRRADALDMRDSVLLALKTTLDAEGVNLPFPIQEIILRDGHGPEHESQT